MTRCGIPSGRYGYDSEIAQASALASADEAREVEWNENQPEAASRFEVIAPGRIAEPLSGSPLPTPDSIPNGKVLRKPYHVHATAISAAATTLERMAVSLYSTGRLITSGRLTHSGGPDGSLLGNHVSIRLTAFAAPAVPTPEALPIDSALVWQASPEHSLWVTRNQPKAVSLAARTPVCDQVLRRHFSEITHFEIELVALRDR